MHGVPPSARKSSVQRRRQPPGEGAARPRRAAHAALVYDGDDCVGWCQFGSPEELPRIKHRRAYDAGAPTPPDWRITCFFAAKTHRRSGVATSALRGALEQIGRLGGGTVESYPEDATGRKVSGSFLYNATLAVFESQGFKRIRQLGKHHWVVRTVVPRSTGNADSSGLGAGR